LIRKKIHLLLSFISITKTVQITPLKEKKEWGERRVKKIKKVILKIEST